MSAELPQPMDACDTEYTADDFESAEYRVELVDEDRGRQLGFSSNIGGVGNASRLVVDLARIKGLTFELRTTKR